MNESIKLIQPYFVIHTERYYKAVCEKYGILHFYMYTVQKKEDIAAVPDGCIDLVFDYDGSRMKARACGTVFAYHKTIFEFGHTYFGVRFLPGVLPCMLNIQLKDLVSREADLMQLTDYSEFLKRMEEQTTFEDCVHTFLEEYGRIFNLKNREEDSSARVLVDHSLHMIYQTSGRVKIQEMEEQTGYSSRYINRVFHEQLGYGPKSLCKIVQFQKILDYMNAMESRLEECRERLTDMAMDCGFYDQPQLIRDFKKYANVTPKKYEKIICQARYSHHIIEQKIII